MAAVDEAERNRAWYRANRRALVYGKHYIIDNGCLAMGPFDTEDALDGFWEHNSCPFSEHAYYVRAGNEDPDSIEETFARCTMLMLQLYRARQHRKLQYVEDMLGDMVYDLSCYSQRANGEQKDRAWDPKPPEPANPLTIDDLRACGDVFATLQKLVAEPTSTYGDMARAYHTINKYCNRAVVDDDTAVADAIIRVYSEAARLMAPVWARTPPETLERVENWEIY